MQILHLLDYIEVEMGIFSIGKKKEQIEIEIDKNKLPEHIAIIPDGNGRWARKRGLPRSAGHREGANVLKKIVKHCSKLGLKYISVYTFSTENWKRPAQEVEALMALLLEFLKNAEKELDGTGVKIKVIGDVTRLSNELQKEIERVESITIDNKGLCLLIALNYGGRDEIVNAVKNIVKLYDDRKIQIDGITEKIISSLLYTSDIPDPDLLIRTSGEKRSSNFLVWQLAYTEFWYTDKLWPEMRLSDIDKAILEFQNRNRRFGGV
jgi:undecaprenyl diphosphate synthase